MLLANIVFQEPLDVGAFTLLGLGFILGLKHALDADHLVAVSAIVSEHKGFLGSSVVGAMWGIGHTASLLAVGILVLALRMQIPEGIATWLEMAVAVMIVFLGVRVLWRLRGGGGVHIHAHSHDSHVHAHPHLHSATELHAHEAMHSPSHHHSSAEGWTGRFLHHAKSGKKSIVIGMVHGMAGSAGLMLLVLSSISSTALGVLCIALFGIGSILGMLVMSTLIGLPFVFTAHRSNRVNVIVRGLAGVISIAFGLFLAWELGGEIFL